MVFLSSAAAASSSSLQRAGGKKANAALSEKALPRSQLASLENVTNPYCSRALWILYLPPWCKTLVSDSFMRVSPYPDLYYWKRRVFLFQISEKWPVKYPCVEEITSVQKKKKKKYWFIWRVRINNSVRYDFHGVVPSIHTMIFQGIKYPPPSPLDINNNNNRASERAGAGWWWRVGVLSPDTNCSSFLCHFNITTRH